MVLPFASRARPLSTPLAGRSYWQRHGGAPVAEGPGDGRAEAPAATRLPQKADFVIVGGGLAGLATAINLAQAEPSASILLLEARFAGFGASGRNAGLLAPLPAPVWLVTAGTNPEHAWGLAHLNREVHRLAAWLRAQDGESGIEPTTLRIASQGRLTSTGLGRVSRTLEKAGVAHTVTNGADGHLMVDLETNAVDPYRTVRMLADIARQRGVAIHERTPVRAIEEAPRGARVVLADGSAIEARTAILCTNGYSSSVALPARIRAKVVFNFMIASGELPPATLAAMPHGDRFVVELNTAYVFYRRHRNRLIYGGIERFKLQGTDDFAVPPDVLSGLERLLGRSFPRTGTTPAEAWGGCYHQTGTDLPLIERAGTNGAIILNVGYGGTGVALTMICGRLAAGLARGRAFADSDDGRILGALESTRVPLAGAARFVAGVAADLLLRR